MPRSPSKKKAALREAIATASERSGLSSSPTKKATARAGRIMHIECKAGALTGVARIGRVTFSQTGRTLYYHGQKFQSLKGAGFKSNYYNVETGDDYWISGPKRTGGDAASTLPNPRALSLIKRAIARKPPQSCFSRFNVFAHGTSNAPFLLVALRERATQKQAGTVVPRSLGRIARHRGVADESPFVCNCLPPGLPLIPLSNFAA
jgi:hypothetical protein